MKCNLEVYEIITIYSIIQVCKKTLEPIWEHDLYINTGTENQIKMEIFDKDKIGKVKYKFNPQKCFNSG